MIHSIEIRGLRGIREGKLGDLAALTILVGPNGCGKSTILDALLIAGSATPADAFEVCAKRRPGLRRGAKWLIGSGSGTEWSSCASLTSDGSTRRCEFSLDPSVSDRNTFTRLRLRTFRGTARPPAPVVDGLALTFHHNGSYDRTDWRWETTGVPNIALVEFDEHEARNPLHTLLTRATERGLRDAVRTYVAAVAPGVIDVVILTEGDLPVVYLVYADSGVPVAVEGQGVQSLLRLCLELAACADGVVLLEEPEVHQHPGAIRQSANAIWAAVRRDVQVVLSTHSLELIDSLISEAPEDTDLAKLCVYRLQLDDGCLKSARLSGDEVVFARGQIQDDLR